jgi:hypothetical protein
MPGREEKNRALPSFLQLTAPVYSREKASSRERNGVEKSFETFHPHGSILFDQEILITILYFPCLLGDFLL